MLGQIKLSGSEAQSLSGKSLERMVSNRRPVPLPTNVNHVSSDEPSLFYQQAGWIEEQIDPNDPKKGWKYTPPRGNVQPVNEKINQDIIRARQDFDTLREINADIKGIKGQGNTGNFGRRVLYVITFGDGFGYFRRKP